MVRFIIFFLLTLCTLWGSEKASSLTPGRDSALERECFQCHKEQKIPSAATYRRYLLKYSSKETIREMMFAYLKTPAVESSIMPPQFFSKFTIKEVSQLKDEALRKRIDEYIDYFDINKKLFIPPENN
ncbi:MAG: hypothetical protein U9R26_08925 [Campylobacterota bacterium]|nr:hypothetical protein [Campylobacterota bacterium]